MSKGPWVGLGVTLALLGAACGRVAEQPTPQVRTTAESPTPAEPTVVRYFTFSAAPDHLDELDQMITLFEQANPDVRVEVETAPFDEYFAKLQTQIAGGEAPDAFELNFENFVAFASKGALADLGSFVQADETFNVSAYYPRAFQAFSLEGTQYALPESYSTVLLFYNKELFERAGLAPPTDDWTWADERAAAERLRALGSDTWGFFAGVHYWEFYKTAAQNGCSFFTDGRVTLNEPACIEALEYMLSYVRDDIQPDDAEMGGLSDGDMFLKGEIAMLTTGIWMFEAFAEAPFEWDVVVEPGNVQKASHFFANGVAVSATSDQQEAAYRWIRFFTSDPQAAEIRVKSAWELPTLTDQSLYESHLTQSPPANRQAVLKSLENIVVPPVIERQSEMQDAVNALLERARAGEISAQEALDQAKAEIEALLAS